VSNRYKADLIEMGIVRTEEAKKMPLILNKNPLSIEGYPLRLMCGYGITPKEAARNALGEAAVTVGGVDMSLEGYNRINDLSTVEYLEDQYKYLCVLVLTPIEEEEVNQGGVIL